MSESLPGTAPSEVEAVPSVEAQAPPTDQAVVQESAPAEDDKYVPASRFNGLMGRFQRAENERNALAAQLEEAQSALAAMQATPPPAKEESAVTDTSALEAQVNSLTQMLQQERLENARSKAIEDFPGAKDFADLIIADTPEDIRAMAQLLHERVNGRQAPAPEGEAPAAPAAEAEAPAAPAVEAPPAPPVSAGGTVVEAPEGAASYQDRIATAIKNKDFKSFWAAKAEQAVADAGGALVLNE